MNKTDDDRCGNRGGCDAGDKSRQRQVQVEGTQNPIGAKCHCDVCQHHPDHTFLEGSRLNVNIEEGKEQHDHEQVLNVGRKRVELREQYPQHDH